MTDHDDDPFDALLAGALAPPARAPDHAFAARIGVAVAEAERFRAWRRRALRRLGSEALILFGLAGAALTRARAPGIERLFEEVTFATPAAAGLVLVLWLALSPQRGSVFSV